MWQLTVGLDTRSYPILIGRGLLAQPDAIAPYIGGRRALIVSNDTIAPLYLEQVQALLGGVEVDTLILPDGEQYKTLDTLNQVFSHLLASCHGRDVTLVALGGGVIGDMTGFAAACYQRGVSFVQLPTTLLAQVDSSVGGKTAVNHPLGKNMIGAFWQPSAVIIDTDTLQTLPQREFAAGLAEVIKYGVIADTDLFSYLENNLDALLAQQSDVLAHVIMRCCQIKADIVSADETERGQRALLNLGHTFGHAIEAHMGYGNWLHGEAVAAGMVMASKLSLLRGDSDASDLARVSRLLERAALPIAPPAEMTLDTFVEHMSRDKKVLDGQMRFIVPRGIGQAEICRDVTREQLAQVIAA